MHADGLESAVKRLQQKPMDIPPAYISLMNCALVVKRVKESSGQSGRRVTTVSEITGATTSHSAFSWNPRSDYFNDDLRESVLFKKISESLGKDLKEILDEHQKRIRIFKWMLEHDIRDYKRVSEMIGKYYRDPQSLLTQMEIEV